MSHLQHYLSNCLLRVRHLYSIVIALNRVYVKLTIHGISGGFFVKVLKENLGTIMMCLFELLVGILLLIDPVGFTTAIIIAAGLALLVIGFVFIVKYFRTEAAEAAKRQYFAKGLVAVFAGAFCAAKSYWFVATFPILTILYGAVILLTGLGKIQMTVDIIRLKKKKWFLAAISAVLAIICGGIILVSPFTTTAVLWVFTGISLIIEAIFDVITLIFGAGSKGETE